MQRLKHPSIAHTEVVFKEKGNHYIVMEYVSGGSLAGWMNRGHKFSLSEVVRVIIPLCDALAYLHKMGITHCDLQPSNVLFDTTGRCKLVDLGIAHISNEFVHRAWHTERDLAIGTVFFMSPEQLDGVRNDPRVDLYALGALLYPALTQSGYKENFGLGLVTTSGSLGLLFAPALPLILYAVIAQQLGIGGGITVNAMFLAGILPGLLMLALLSLWSIYSSRGQDAVPFNRSEALAAARDAGWEIPLPLLVLGGIYSGFFAISEAAAVTVLYLFIVEVLIKREISLRQLPKVMSESMIMVGGILVILGLSLASTNYLIDAEILSSTNDI